MANYGFISLHRQIMEHWIFNDDDPFYFKWWIELLMLAAFKKTKERVNGQLVTVERGEYITSEYKLAARWGVTREKVRKFLSDLESDYMVEISKNKRIGMRIRIVNYSAYQNANNTKTKTADNMINEIPGKQTEATFDMADERANADELGINAAGDDKADKPAVTTDKPDSINVSEDSEDIGYTTGSFREAEIRTTEKRLDTNDSEEFYTTGHTTGPLPGHYINNKDNKDNKENTEKSKSKSKSKSRSESRPDEDTESGTTDHTTDKWRDFNVSEDFRSDFSTTGQEDVYTTEKWLDSNGSKVFYTHEDTTEFLTDLERIKTNKPDVDEPDNGTIVQPKADKTMTETPPAASPKIYNFSFEREKKLSSTVPDAKNELIDSAANTHQEDFNTYKEMLQENICYSEYVRTRPFEIDLVDELVNCMLDVIFTEGHWVRINGENKNRAMVISQYLKINSNDIDHIIDRFKAQGHYITRIGNYLKTMLYTVKLENSHFYTNQYETHKWD